MQVGKSERVILIKGDATQWYEQAIFIVNKNLPREHMPVNFVAEAEKIISNYISQNNARPSSKSVQGYAYKSAAVLPDAPVVKYKSAKDKRFDFFLNSVMVLGCIVIACVFLLGLLG